MEFLWQPLTRNPQFTIAIGRTSKVAWGPFAAGPGFSLLEWKNFSTLGQQDQMKMLKKYRGGVSMAVEVSEVTAGMENEEVESDSNDCFGLFTPRGQPIATGHSMLDED